MESIKELFKIGHGPSSSHTMGPAKAAAKIKNKYRDANFFRIFVYNSLALTGEGHLTFKTIEEELFPNKCEFIKQIDKKEHPNTIIFEVYKQETLLDVIKVVSVGGGKIAFDNESREIRNVYRHGSFKKIKEYCLRQKIDLFEYVIKHDDKDIYDYLELIWNQMKKVIVSGLTGVGVLPGELGVKKKAKKLFEAHIPNEFLEDKRVRLVSAYSYACTEENASGEIIVTAPTCGACGVLPSVLFYHNKHLGYSDSEIIKSLGVAGIIGNIIKTNASISGAEAGCQAEIGSACSMTAAAVSYLRGLDIEKQEYAAEVALEHSLGLTCDPVRGYVQIPCIERNAVFAMKALNAVTLADLTSSESKVAFDTVVETMLQTGKDLGFEYRETAEGGLAKHYKDKRSKKC